MPQNLLKQLIESKPLMFLIMFVVPATLMVLLAIYVAGGTSLTCRRVESTQIDCVLSDVRWLGLVNTGETVLKHLQGARLESYECSETDSQGRRQTRQCNSLVLITADGEVRPDLLTNSSAEINNFIASREDSLTVHNNRWIFSGAVGVFALVWLGAGSLIGRLWPEKRRTKWSK